MEPSDQDRLCFILCKCMLKTKMVLVDGIKSRDKCSSLIYSTRQGIHPGPSSLFSHIDNMENSLLDDASNSDVAAVRLRLSEERSKRLLMRNDVDTLMIKVEELQRKACKCTADDTSATPKTVFFNAKLSGYVTYEALRVVVFDKVIENEGDGYSPVTGVFRAPVAGIYQFSVSILSQSKTKHAHIQLMKGETELGRLYAGDVVAHNGQMGTITVNTRLAKGDEVFARELAAGNTGYVHGDNYSSFTGVLLYM